MNWGSPSAGSPAVVEGPVGLSGPTSGAVARMAWHDAGMPDGTEYAAGDRVVYVAEPVFDEIIRTGEVGIVDRVEDGWVFAWWPRSGRHSVPVGNVRPEGD